jgi:hypothetical protein
MKLPVKKTPFTLCYALIFAFIVCAPRAVLANTDNLLNDAGFEQQLSAGQGGWILFDESRFSSDQARGGRQSVFNWGFSRSLPSPPFLLGTASGSYQEFSARPGSRWRLTGYSFTPAALKGISVFGIVQVSFFDERGNDLGTVETAKTKGPRAKTSNLLTQRKFRPSPCSSTTRARKSHRVSISMTLNCVHSMPAAMDRTANRLKTL